MQRGFLFFPNRSNFGFPARGCTAGSLAEAALVGSESGPRHWPTSKLPFTTKVSPPIKLPSQPRTRPLPMKGRRRTIGVRCILGNEFLDSSLSERPRRVQEPCTVLRGHCEINQVAAHTHTHTSTLFMCQLLTYGSPKTAKITEEEKLPACVLGRRETPSCE